MRRPGRLAIALFLGVFIAVQWAPEVPGSGLVDDKVGHVALYYGLALVLWPLVPATDPLARAGVVVSLGYLVAIVMETGQHPPRQYEALDAVADLLGLVLAAGPMAWAALHPVRALRAPRGAA